jgi:hypothetical protein
MTRRRVVVAASIGDPPNHGGAAWAGLQWALGADVCGHDVAVVEECASASAASRAAFHEAVDEVGWRGPAVHYGRDLATASDRDAREAAARWCAAADVVVDVGGTLRDDGVLGACARRLYVDVDPGFTQWWWEQGHDVGLGARLDRHTHHATVGLAVGRPGCAVPTLGLRWRPTPPPVDLRRWPVVEAPAAGRFAVIGNWRSYGPVERDGVRYGQRAHAVRPLASLGTRLPWPVEAALAIDPGDGADRDRLVAHGWRLVDPVVAAGSPARYRATVAAAAAELGVAKHGYVAAATGWVSDRTACFLASGRPALLTDTGAFPDGAPPGVLVAGDVDGLVAAGEDLVRRWPAHARGARATAASWCDAGAVVGALLTWVLG